jgi:hypothetical protein
MKHFLLSIIAIIVLAAGTASAQNINIGVKAGLNSFTIQTDNSTNYDSKTGLHIGLLGHIHLNEQYAFQPEIVYSMQGAKSGNTDINLDYINIPLIFQYMFDNGFRIEAGPQIGLLLNAKAVNGSSEDITDDFKTIDLGLGFGVSYVHPPTGFGAGARYNLGLTDITETSNATSANRGLQIGVFYLFNHRN